MMTRLTWTAATWAVALAGFIGLQGCATVRSAPDQRFDTQPTGIAYFLPMRLARLTITQTPVSLADLITDRDDKIVARAAARAAATAATAKREQAQTALNAAAAAAANRADLTRALETATADEAKAKTAAAAANAAVDAVTRDIYAASVNGQSCAFVPTIDLLPVQADRRRRFALQPAHNELRDDTLKIGLTPTSLLTTGDVTAVDQTGQIIVDLAGVAGAAAGVGRDGGGAKDDGCRGPAVWATIFDPVEDGAVAEVNRQLETVGLPFFRLTSQIDGPAISRRRTTDTALPDALPDDRAMEGVFYRSAAPVLLTLYRENQAAEGGSAPVVSGPIPETPAAARSSAETEAADADGAVDDDLTGWTPAMAAVLVVPQAGPVSRLSLPASPFVRTHHAYEFADGALISVSSERPGAVPAAFKVPLLALDAFTTAFAKAVAVRVDIRSTRISDDTAAIDAVVQDRLNTALMSCLDAAGTDTAAISACAGAYRSAGSPTP